MLLRKSRTSVIFLQWAIIQYPTSIYIYTYIMWWNHYCCLAPSHQTKNDVSRNKSVFQLPWNTRTSTSYWHAFASKEFKSSQQHSEICKKKTKSRFEIFCFSRIPSVLDMLGSTTSGFWCLAWLLGCKFVGASRPGTWPHLGAEHVNEQTFGKQRSS